MNAVNELAGAVLPMKEKFVLPEGVIYLDGNSLGPLPVGVTEVVSGMMRDQWGAHLIKGWNVDGWMAQPSRVGDRVGRLIGAPAGSVVMGDTLSLKVYQALSAALQMRPERKVVLSDSGNFPTDLYMADGLIRQLSQGHELRVVAPEDVAGAIDDTVAAVMITQVDYRTGRVHDMDAITAEAQAAGAVMIWDLAHSAGAIPVDIAGSGAEFAVGCTYKYLNGGPGAPAFIYVRPDIVNAVNPALAGWLGHEAPFAFDLDYRPGAGIERMRVGTPPVIQLTALEHALRVWDGVDMQDIRAASIALSEQFITEVEATCPQLALASPRDAAARGSQVSFHFEHGYAAMQALIARGVIGDFRAPDIMRFGFTPLYLDSADISQAVAIMSEILRDRLWDRPEYTTRQRVT
ncbi:kynureninase [Gymnodinialimonas sp.]